LVEQRALILEEIEQIGHLFEVGGHVGDVASQVDIIELEVDDMLDAIGETALAVTLHCGRVAAERDGRQSRDSKRNHPFHLPRSPIPFLRTARRRGGRGT
jgi:hypothetical protein